ncbi:unnamed protein product [Protopolystoma xenopodis]|uniref:Uncharacterized protein n=1 Tax=Protopolystoma xenopodis TaxID=117903 RepID=A0A448WBG2_9PLAT|nr:unnamed protein product [Protopolystoma xenopodis]
MIIIISHSLAGLLCFIIACLPPKVLANYKVIASFAGLFGAFTAPLLALISHSLIECVGLNDFADALAISMFSNGLSMCIGGPFSGTQLAIAWEHLRAYL